MKKESIWHNTKVYIYILPSLALFFFFFLYPIIYSVQLSLTDAHFVNLIKGPNDVGFLNYFKLLTSDLYPVLIRTLIWVCTSVSLKVFVGLLFAIVFSSEFVKFKGILGPLALLPWAVPWFLSVLIWRGLFSTDFGAINQALLALGFEKVNWLMNQTNAFIAYNTVEAWLAYPFMMSVTLAAIYSIPVELNESAVMDGASLWKKFRYITLPLIKKPLAWATIMTSLTSFMMFGVPWLLNLGGPARSNEFLLVYGYREAFSLGRFGYASAFMVLVFVMLAGLAIILIKATKLLKEE